MTMKNYRNHSSIALVLIACIAAFCNRGVDKSDQDEGEHPLRVRVASVQRDTVPLPIVIPGKLTPAAQLKLGFKTGGIIRDLHAIEGANVAGGTRLALLDTIEFVAWRDKAQTALEKAKRDFVRAQKLYTDSVATLERLQNAQSALHAAESDSAIAAFNLKQAVLTAPSSGKILKRLVEKDEVIGPGMPAVIFASTEGTWTVVASVPDRDLLDLTIGDKAIVNFDAIPRREFEAALTRVAGAAHPVTGTFEIELALKGIHPGFRPGLFADVRLYPRNFSKLAFIPATALVGAQGDTGTVYAICAGDAVKPVTVTIARLCGNLLAVSAGLDGVDEVVTAGAPYVVGAPAIAIDRN